MVDIINPVFLISWLYLSVYWNESKSINTSAKINIVKNSLKKRLFKFSLKDSSIKTQLYQFTKLTMHIENRIGRRTILTNFFEAINLSNFSETGFTGNLSLVTLNK